MKKISSQGFSHHILLPAIAILVVGTIGAYLTFASKAATPAQNPAPKIGWVDDGPYADKTNAAPSMTHNYTEGGTTNPYYFALNDVGMRHVVLNVGLRELLIVNSTTGATTYRAKSIENRLANVIAWNSVHPDKKLTVHLRIHVGERAPAAWKVLAGTVVLKDPQGHVTDDTTVPRWWAKKNDKYLYDGLYSSAMAALATAVKNINNNPATLGIIGSVNAPGAAPNYPEPMVLYGYSAENAAALKAKGFTPKEHDRFMGWFPSASAPFKGIVKVELAVNPYQNLTDSGEIDKSKLTRYQTVANTFIKAMGSDAVLANYSAREEYFTPAGDEAYRTMYSWMLETAKKNRLWTGLQLARPHKISSNDPTHIQAWNKVATMAANKGFNFVETSGPRVSPTSGGDANVWPQSYSDGPTDVATMKAIQTKLLSVPHP